MGDLPAHVRSEVERILDAAARRLLAEEVDSDTLGAAAGRDDRALDRRTDQRAPLVKGETIPVAGRVDDDRGTLAA